MLASRHKGLNLLYILPAAVVYLAYNAYEGGLEDEKKIERRKHNLSLPPIALPQLLTDEVLQDLDHRLVYVAGEFLHEREMRVLPKYYESFVGLHIYTPLRRSDGSSVIINRGWVPPEMKDPETRQEAAVTEKVTILGHLLGSEDSATFSLGGAVPLLRKMNMPDRNMWARVDLKEMGEWVNASPVLISAVGWPVNPGGYPIGGQTDFQLDNWRYKLSLELAGASCIMLAVLVGRKVLTRGRVRLPWQKPPPPHTPFTD